MWWISLALVLNIQSIIHENPRQMSNELAENPHINQFTVKQVAHFTFAKIVMFISLLFCVTSFFMRHKYVMNMLLSS